MPKKSQKNSKLVSIIINNYNYSAFLPKAIESSINQTYADIEIIVVDDGSTDSSLEVASSYAHLVNVISKSNGGQASAMNVGFRESKGDIVIFLDADDFLEKDCAEKVIAAFNESENSSKIQYVLATVDGNGESLGGKIPKILLKDKSQARHDLESFGGYSSPPTSGNAFSRSFLELVIPIPEKEYRISADGYLIVLAPLFGDVVQLREVLGNYRIHGSNAWSTFDVNKLHSHVSHGIQKAGLIYKFTKSDSQKSLDKNFKFNAVRLSSLKLAPHLHPIAKDSLLGASLMGIISVINDSNLNFKQKSWWSFWFIGVCFAPKNISRHFVYWLMLPHSRPKGINKIVGRKN